MNHRPLLPFVFLCAAILCEMKAHRPPGYIGLLLMYVLTGCASMRVVPQRSLTPILMRSMCLKLTALPCNRRSSGMR